MVRQSVNRGRNGMSSDLSLEKRIVQSQQRFQLLPPDVQASYREQVAAWEGKRKAWFAAVKREAALKLLAAGRSLKPKQRSGTLHG